jgi:CubicO group peptidase (beta-lactamase class C family)
VGPPDATTRAAEQVLDSERGRDITLRLEPMSPTSSPLRAFVEAQVASGALVGAVAAMVLPDASEQLCAAGFADAERAQPMRLNTIVRLHSLSKALTSAALLTLVDAGACELGTPLADILPAFGSWRTARLLASRQTSPPITLRHLLTHSSGFSYPKRRGTPAERSLAQALGAAASERSLPLSEWSERIAHGDLAHEPGASFSYGVSTDLLGRVIEVLSDLPLDRFLRERLTEPLGMHDTAFAVPPEKLQRLARLYRTTGSGHELHEAQSAEQPVFLSGGAGLFSTANDYLRFCRMLLAEGELDARRVLRAETVRSFARCLLTGHIPARDLERGLGRGVGHGLIGRVVTDPRRSGYGSAGTYGWDGAAGCTFLVDPERKVAALLMTQIFPWQPRLLPEFRRSVEATTAAFFTNRR